MMTLEPRIALEELAVRRAREDVNALIELCMLDEKRQPIVQANIHRKLQSFITENDSGVVMFPRGHGKTTQMLGRIAWEIGRNPNERIKIVSSSDSIATARGAALRQILESPKYQAVFPNIKRGEKWSDGALSVERDVIMPEATLECYGIDSAVIGGRASKLFLDDPDDEEVCYSGAMRKRNTDRIDNAWLNLLMPGDRVYELCTPWHAQDIAHTRRNWPVLRIAIQGGNPVWPEIWNTEALTERREQIGSLSFARAFELKLMSPEDQLIKESWFRYFDHCPSLQALIVSIDPAITKTSSSDSTGIVVAGIDNDGKCYVLYAVKKKIGFAQSLHDADAIARQYQTLHLMQPTILVEGNAYQAALPQMLKNTSAFPIVQIIATKAKHYRVAQLGVHFENGRVYLRGENDVPDVSQRELFDECVNFPGAAHDDLVDALAQAVSYLTENVVLGGSVARTIERDAGRSRPSASNDLFGNAYR